ncbi:pseudouridine synthase [Clostridia bacterium]|nr:pseudouridine synthase [Clostridia bacterium]
MKTLTIGSNDEGQRLDKFLQKITILPESLMHRYIRKKRIKLNHKRCEHKVILQKDDILELFIGDEFFEQGEKTNFLRTTSTPDVFYEDENILIANKPPGQLAHENEDEKINTLVNSIKLYLFRKGEYDPAQENSFAPALCHMIDRNTGGLVIAAKNAQALRIINQKIKKREVKKTYLCLIHGVPQKKEDLLTAYLQKDENNNLVEISKFSKPGYRIIKTKYKILETNGAVSLLEINLITGRTHQIRAHLAYIGYPLIGDNKYGNAEKNRAWGFKFQALCASGLRFEFNSSAGNLDYLQNKEFKLKKIWFTDKKTKKQNGLKFVSPGVLALNQM